MKKQSKNSEKHKKLKLLAAGDFHGDKKVAERLAKRALKEHVDLVVLTGDMFGLTRTEDIIKPFIKNKQKVVFVPGNWETTPDSKELEKKYKIKNIENHYLKYKGIGIFGLGSADWALYPDDERSFKHLKSENEKIKNLEKKIMVSHIHAAGTKSELSGIPGSEGIRKAIDKLQPDLFISGHIHELEGAEEKIGKTKVINIGKKGKIIEI